jgi:hypothetical protein
MNQSTPSERFARLEELLFESVTRALSPDERSELNAILRADPVARAHAARWMIDDALLADRLRESTAAAMFDGEAAAWASIGGPRTSRKQPGRAWRTWLPLGAAAALALIGSIVWFAVAGPHRVVARYGELEACHWVKATEENSPGDGLKPGQVVELSAGRAEIIFTCGAVITLHGPCIFEIESARSAYLVLGEAHTRAESPESKGFALRTRLSRIVDLGTEFITSVAADGHSCVEVTEGEVMVDLPGKETPQYLGLGDSLSLEPGRGRVMVRIERGDESRAFRFPTIEPPTDADDADAKQGRAHFSVGYGSLHRTQSATRNSGPVEKLNDGRGQTTSDEPQESVFFTDNTEGCIALDLGAPMLVDKVNTYSWHKRPLLKDIRYRAQQRYRLYGSVADAPPPVTGDPGEAGWTFIARVNTDEHFGVRQLPDRPAQQACSITSQAGTLGRYRFLLWVVEPILLPDKKVKNHTFYGEFDVFTRP